MKSILRRERRIFFGFFGIRKGSVWLLFGFPIHWTLDG